MPSATTCTYLNHANTWCIFFVMQECVRFAEAVIAILCLHVPWCQHPARSHEARRQRPFPNPRCLQMTEPQPSRLLQNNRLSSSRHQGFGVVDSQLQLQQNRRKLLANLIESPTRWSWEPTAYPEAAPVWIWSVDFRIIQASAYMSAKGTPKFKSGVDRGPHCLCSGFYISIFWESSFQALQGGLKVRTWQPQNLAQGAGGHRVTMVQRWSQGALDGTLHDTKRDRKPLGRLRHHNRTPNILRKAEALPA